MVEIGYIQTGDPQIYRDGVVDLLLDATEPAYHKGDYEFGESDLALRMSEKVMTLRFEAGCWRLPPPDILFLHRKLGGLYMLCARLQAQIAVSNLLSPYLTSP